jgi:hypothetical protein
VIIFIHEFSSFWHIVYFNFILEYSVDSFKKVLVLLVLIIFVLDSINKSLNASTTDSGERFTLKLKYLNVAAPVNCYFFDLTRIDRQKDLAFIENMISNYVLLLPSLIRLHCL